ncbi:MAG: hypothetical protein JRI91_01595 [Deltaproteobacteria bacterium]|nr:hypothetical protein [Deltaproteobacteria bacterium]
MENKPKFCSDPNLKLLDKVRQVLGFEKFLSYMAVDVKVSASTQTGIRKRCARL